MGTPYFVWDVFACKSEKHIDTPSEEVYIQYIE